VNAFEVVVVEGARYTHTESWTRESLSAFDSRELEYLVANCWKVVFDALLRVTRVSRDGGVDVVSRLPTAATVVPFANRSVVIEVNIMMNLSP
jgi:hypothetical protein